MNTEKGIRRSGRQSTLTKFFVPNCDVTHETKKRTGKREQGYTNDDPIEMPNSNEKAKKRRQGKKGSSDVANKEQRMDNMNELHSDEELSDNEDQENLGSLANMETPDSPEWSSKGKTKSKKAAAAPKAKKKSSGMKPSDAPTEPKKRKTKFEKINDQLKALGVYPDDGSGNCARAAIYSGFIKLTGKPSDLDQVIVSDTLQCGHKCDATLGDLLKQPDYGGCDYEDGLQDATVICEQCAPDDEDDDEDDYSMSRTYVTRICSGNPTFDSGKFHNHCTKCKLFGKCIGDYREMHCTTIVENITSVLGLIVLVEKEED